MPYADKETQKSFLREYARKRRGTLKERHLEYWRSLSESELSLLTPTERSDLQQYYELGKPKKEIAEDRKVSVGTVNWCIGNALKKINDNHR